MLNRRLLRIKVLQVLYGYYSGNGDDLARAEADLSRIVELYYRLVLDVARLPWMLTQEMERRLAHGMQKIRPTEEERHPNRRFVENQVIAALAENPLLKPKEGTVSDDWCNREELLSPLLNLQAIGRMTGPVWRSSTIGSMIRLTSMRRLPRSRGTGLPIWTLRSSCSMRW